MPVTGARGTSGHGQYSGFNVYATSKQALSQRMHDACPSPAPKAPQDMANTEKLTRIARPTGTWPTDGRCMPFTGARGTSGHDQYGTFNMDTLSKRALSQRMNDACPSPALEAPRGTANTVDSTFMPRPNRPVVNGQTMHARHRRSRHLRTWTIRKN